MSRAHIMQAAEDSLRRSDTDYIDLYQIHWDDQETPLDETLKALDDLVKQGKVRYLGCSNISAWRLMKALCTSDTLGLSRYESLQPHYNLVHRSEFEAELMPLCQSETLAVIPYSPLAGGFLTGKYQSTAPQPDSARRGSVKRYFNDHGWRILHAVEKVANARGATPLQIALAWQLTQSIITAPIIGANSVEQLIESLGAVAMSLTEEEMAALNEASHA